MDYFKKYLNVLDGLTPAELQARDDEIEKREREQAEADKAERYRKSGVPERYWAESLATYTTGSKERAEAKAAAEKFFQAIKCGAFRTLAFIGGAGTGKTHLACAIVREYGGLYRTAPDLVEELRRAKSFTAADTEAAIVQNYGHARLLVVDEIGRGINAADEKYMLYQIINARYNTRRPTVLISNFKKAEFLQYIGIAAADRLVESGEIRELTGESYRKELRK